MIAHRLDTVKNCDIIFKINKGQVVEQGDFNKIIHRKNYI
jgi:ABC-type multidrug transport system fused ATPase/permease subunit